MQNKDRILGAGLLLVGAAIGAALSAPARVQAQGGGGHVERWEYATMSLQGNSARLWTPEGGYFYQVDSSRQPEAYLNNRSVRAFPPAMVQHLNAAGEMGWEAFDQREDGHAFVIFLRRQR